MDGGGYDIPHNRRNVGGTCHSPARSRICQMGAAGQKVLGGYLSGSPPNVSKPDGLFANSKLAAESALCVEVGKAGYVGKPQVKAVFPRPGYHCRACLDGGGFP